LEAIIDVMITCFETKLMERIVAREIYRV